MRFAPLKAKCCAMIAANSSRLLWRVVRRRNGGIGTLWGVTPPEYLRGVVTSIVCLARMRIGATRSLAQIVACAAKATLAPV